MPNDRLILRLNSRKVQFLPTLVENANRSWASIKTEKQETLFSFFYRFVRQFQVLFARAPCEKEFLELKSDCFVVLF